MLLISSHAKTTSLLLAIVMLWLYGGGRVNAENYATYANGTLSITNPGERFDALLAELKDVVSHAGAQSGSAPEKGSQNIRRLVELKQRLAEENSKVQKYFSQLERLMKEKKLAGEMLNRQAEFVRQYNVKYEALIAHLEGIESAHDDATGLWGKLTGKEKKIDWDGVLGKALSFLEENTTRRSERHFDAKNLPHRSLQATNPIPPKLTRNEWLKAFAKDAPATASLSAPSSSAKTQDRLTLAATAPPTPADLAETIEVKFTPEIRQLADSLGRNPVKIFNWVRNQIEFVPTWGSIQGAQLCFENRAGNAFDTASLLVALLRYSGIAARYQMGTIEVPIDKFMNWAGGFTNAEAAASLFASGGVPSVVRRVNQNGQVVTVKLEHVWVKAFVDYAPSGGAVHRQGDTWVEMDAGFKQYLFTQGVDFEAAIPSNTQTFVNQLASTATIDPATGSVTNINSSAIQSFSQQTTDARISHVRNNLPNATRRELFGGKTIPVGTSAVLSAATSYRVLARASEASEVPDALRHKVTFSLGSNAQTPDAADLWSYTASLPELAGKGVLLLYTLASQADEQLLQSAVIPPGSVHASWPSLINLVPQLYIGNQVVAEGRPLRTGSQIVSQITFSSPTISTPVVSNTMFAGESAAIGLDLQGITQAQVHSLRQKTQNFADKLQQRDFQNITNREFTEAFLSSNIIGWFGFVDEASEQMSRDAGVVTIRYPSAGLFFFKQGVSSLFGAPVSVSAEGFNMDIDRDIVISVAKDGDAAKTAALTFTQGAFGSAMEAALPVRALSTASNSVSGIGTMQALKLANDQGIPIYQINASNASTILPLLQIDPGDLADIQDAISAGLEVTVSKTPVNFNGRNVLGMAIRDPLTGSASFLISGGTNGAILLLTILVILAIIIIGVFFPFLIPFALVPTLTLFQFTAIGTALIGILLALETVVVLQGDDSPAYELSACALTFFILAGLATAIGVIVCLPCLIIGSVGSVAIGAIGMVAC